MLSKLQRRARVVLSTLIAVLALAASGQAQNAYYREAEKDGRIFVFNSDSAFKVWEGSGEAGVGAITLLGHGPKGETMVFDSENAIHLYNFKHDRPGEVFKTSASGEAADDAGEPGRTARPRSRRTRPCSTSRTASRSASPSRCPTTPCSSRARRRRAIRSAPSASGGPR